MRRSKRLQPVLQIAERKEQEAMEVFGQGSRVLEEQKAKLQELHLYLQEYRQGLLQRGRAGVTGQQLRQLQQFIAQLEAAIREQQALIQVTEEQSALNRERWLDLRGKREAMEKVILRAREEEDMVQMKQEQKESDERAQLQRERSGFGY
ncbi:MAG: flagellar export protein FliJ [Gammaproteobacteria bacterium]|nr:flagellar export protein FliJ [Gammaproteobacteria bacterium]